MLDIFSNTRGHDGSVTKKHPGVVEEKRMLGAKRPKFESLARQILAL